MLFQLSYGQKIGAGSRIRTRDIFITSEALFQLSYASIKGYRHLAICFVTP